MDQLDVPGWIFQSDASDGSRWIAPHASWTDVIARTVRAEASKEGVQEPDGMLCDVRATLVHLSLAMRGHLNDGTTPSAPQLHSWLECLANAAWTTQHLLYAIENLIASHPDDSRLSELRCRMAHSQGLTFRERKHR